MWLADDTNTSVPMEGGTSICEFLVDNSGQEVQRISVISDLPRLLDDDDDEEEEDDDDDEEEDDDDDDDLEDDLGHKVRNIKHFLVEACQISSSVNSHEVLHVAQAEIQEVLHGDLTEMQLDNSSNFLTILEKELISHSTFTETFLQSILTNVDSKDPVVANAWLETLLDVIDLLPKDIIKREILSIAIAKGQLSQPVQSRLACCKMIGKIASKFEPYLIKKEILPVVQSLCQDVDFQVRGCMCRQLDAVAKGMGLEASKSAILPELVELANDEESHVRLAGIETVVNMLSLLDDDTCTQIIIPLVMKFCENSMKVEDATLSVVARQLGKLCHGLLVNLTLDQMQWFLNYYRNLAKLGLPDFQQIKEINNTVHNPFDPEMPTEDDVYSTCRQSCAYNCPAMVLFAGPHNFKMELYETFSDLSRDPHHLVRRTIACGFHEVAKLLGPSVAFIQGEIITLLKDESIEVLKGIIPHLPETLEALARAGSMNSESKLTNSCELIHALMSCEVVVASTSNWRLHAEFLEKMSCLPKCLTSDHIYEKFLPLFFKKLHTARAIPCRMAAARTMLVFLRNNRKLDQRQELCTQIVEEFCHGFSCYSRILFINICKLVMELFSKAFFKDYFFEPLLQLASDPVPNVRLRLCYVLPSLKAQLNLPIEDHLLQLLESCVRQLMSTEKDKDVAAAVRNAIMELDRIEAEMEMSHDRLSYCEDDHEDEKKEEEERLLLELEEKEKKEEENRNAKTGDKKPSARPLGKIPVRKQIASPKLSRLPTSKTMSSLASLTQKSSTKSPRSMSPIIPLKSPARTPRSMSPSSTFKAPARSRSTTPMPSPIKSPARSPRPLSPPLTSLGRSPRPMSPVTPPLRSPAHSPARSPRPMSPVPSQKSPARSPRPSSPVMSPPKSYNRTPRPFSPPLKFTSKFPRPTSPTSLPLKSLTRSTSPIAPVRKSPAPSPRNATPIGSPQISPSRSRETSPVVSPSIMSQRRNSISRIPSPIPTGIPRRLSQGNLNGENLNHKVPSPTNSLGRPKQNGVSNNISKSNSRPNSPSINGRNNPSNLPIRKKATK